MFKISYSNRLFYMANQRRVGNGMFYHVFDSLELFIPKANHWLKNHDFVWFLKISSYIPHLGLQFTFFEAENVHQMDKNVYFPKLSQFQLILSNIFRKFQDTNFSTQQV